MWKEVDVEHRYQLKTFFLIRKEIKIRSQNDVQTSDTFMVFSRTPVFWKFLYQWRFYRGGCRRRWLYFTGWVHGVCLQKKKCYKYRQSCAEPQRVLPQDKAIPWKNCDLSYEYSNWSWKLRWETHIHNIYLLLSFHINLLCRNNYCRLIVLVEWFKNRIAY